MATIGEIASRVIAGEYGTGNDRANRLTAAGYNADEVQKAVNGMLLHGKKASDYPTLTGTQTAAQNSTAAQTGAAQTQTGTAQVTPVTYIDADGTKKTGYVKDNLTYTDEAATNRIGVGSSVQGADGTWYTLTDTGGQKAGTDDSAYYNYLMTDAGQQYIAEKKASEESPRMQSLREQLAVINSALATAQSSNDAILTAQLQQQQANIQAQIENLNSQYNAANKQLYVDAMKSKRDLPQALAALGYTGGLRESSLLGIDTDYANALNENEIAKAGDIAAIQSGANADAADLYIAQLQANQDAQDTYTTRYLNILQAMAEQEQAEKEAAEEAELEKAQLLYQLGDTGNLYSLLGVEQPQEPEQEQVQEQIQEQVQEQPEKTGEPEDEEAAANPATAFETTLEEYKAVGATLNEMLHAISVALNRKDIDVAEAARLITKYKEEYGG